MKNIFILLILVLSACDTLDNTNILDPEAGPDVYVGNLASGDSDGDSLANIYDKDWPNYDPAKDPTSALYYQNNNDNVIKNNDSVMNKTFTYYIVNTESMHYDRMNNMLNIVIDNPPTQSFFVEPTLVIEGFSINEVQISFDRTLSEISVGNVIDQNSFKIFYNVVINNENTMIDTLLMVRVSTQYVDMISAKNVIFEGFDDQTLKNNIADQAEMTNGGDYGGLWSTMNDAGSVVRASNGNIIDFVSEDNYSQVVYDGSLKLNLNCALSTGLNPFAGISNHILFGGTNMIRLNGMTGVSINIRKNDISLTDNIFIGFEVEINGAIRIFGKYLSINQNMQSYTISIEEMVSEQPELAPYNVGNYIENVKGFVVMNREKRNISIEIDMIEFNGLDYVTLINNNK